MRGRLGRLLGGAPAGPLLVLFGLNFVDEFDRVAFAALSPEIRDAFGLDDTGIGAITVLTGVMVLVAALPVGVLADRLPRVRLAAVAALLWGSMAVLTGVVPTVALLVVVRLLSGIGRIVNEVVHPSLLTDYYDPRLLPRVFAVHRLANPLSGVAGIIAGVIARALGWQWAFYLLAIPTFLLLGGLLRLREPLRGERIDAELAAATAGERISAAEARRQLYAVRTLRRMWAAALLLGLAIVSTPTLLALFYERVYGFEEVGRGAVVFLYSAGIVAGLLVGGVLADRAERAGRTPELASITGLSGVWAGAAMLATVLLPVAGLSLVATTLSGVGAGVFNPAYFPLVGRVAPPRVRSQAYAWAIVYLAAGALVSVALFAIGQAHGYRWALGILAVDVIAAGLVARSARASVDRDVAEAEATLALAVRLRDELATTGQQALLVCRGLGVAYDGVQVLFGVDLEVRAGEIVALLGTNGAGKSTVLRAISGLVDPNQGAIFFDGQDITHADANRTAGLGIVQVPGGRAVFPSLTVAEHLRLAAWSYRQDHAAAAAAAGEVLELFPALRDRIDQLAGNLSGGEQQMLGLAMALVQRPRLLLIDELSLGLAPVVVAELLRTVQRIRDRGVTVLLVEQSVDLALSVADRAYFLEKGEVRFEGPAQQLRGRDDLLRAVFLRTAPASAVRTRAGGGGAAGDGAGGDGAVTLEVEELVRSYGGIRAVDGVSLAVRRGEILGIIGPNGAGKTTLFDLISGHTPTEAGRVWLDGRDVTTAPAYVRARLGLGRSFQDARLVGSLTVAENLALALERHLPVRSHLAALFGLPDVALVEQDVAWTVTDLIELLGLGAFRNKFVRELSTGTRRIVDLGMVLAHDPRVLLLDEPSAGIAQREAEALGPLLQRIRDEVGCAMVVVEHDVPLLSSIADRMVAMVLGRVVAEGSPAEVIAHPEVVEAYLGTDRRAVQRSGGGG